MEQEITSKVWRMRGIFQTAIPGYLLFKDNTVAFVTEHGKEFEVPLSGLKEVKWPRLQMGFGFETEVNGTKYKFTFMKPNGAPQLNDSVLSKIGRVTRIGMEIDSIVALAKWGDSKKSAKAWKEVLEARQPA